MPQIILKIKDDTALLYLDRIVCERVQRIQQQFIFSTQPCLRFRFKFRFRFSFSSRFSFRYMIKSGFRIKSKIMFMRRFRFRFVWKNRFRIKSKIMFMRRFRFNIRGWFYINLNTSDQIYPQLVKNTNLKYKEIQHTQNQPNI